MPLGGSRGPGSASGLLVAAKVVKCPKSYYTEHFEKYGYIRDKYDTTYNTPTPYDPSLEKKDLSSINLLVVRERHFRAY